MYVLIKILKFCTGSSVKSYQCKFAMDNVLVNIYVSNEEGLGDAIQEVIHYYTLRGKFSSVHPELRREGITRVEVGKEGLHFVRDSGVLQALTITVSIQVRLGRIVSLVMRMKTRRRSCRVKPLLSQTRMRTTRKNF